MKKKSKFLTFILSFVPGLGHIYLGLLQRGIVFFLATAFVILCAFLLDMLRIFYEPIPLAILPFIWLAALVDSLILADRINRKIIEARETGTDMSNAWKIIEEEFKVQNSKILTLTFSIIPGAGHMYVGQMEKGIQLMAAFFLTLYLSDFLNLSLLLMFAPILWFYSIFDMMHKVANPEKPQQDVTFIGDFFRENQFSGKAGKFLGIGLIAVGCIMIFDKILLPQLAVLFNEQLRDYLRTGIIAILFIAGGIKLMMGSKDKAIGTGGQEPCPIEGQRDCPAVPGTAADTYVKGVEE